MGYIPEEARKMMEKLIQKALQLGRAPSFDEVNDDPEMPHPNSYAPYFGSFGEACNRACREAFVHKRSVLPNLRGADGSIRIFSEEEEKFMSRQQIPTPVLVASLLRLQSELGRFPSISEVREDKRCASPMTYENRFGGVAWSHLEKQISNWIREGNNGAEAERALEELGTDRPVIAAKSKTKPQERKEGKTEMSKSEESPIAERPAVNDSSTAQPSETTNSPAVQSGAVAPSAASVTLIPPVVTEVSNATIISLIPQKAIKGIPVSEYAAVVPMEGSISVPLSICGIPVNRSFSSLLLCRNGAPVPFPSPSDGVYYLVERSIAMMARAAGRETSDMLIPEKYKDDNNAITIQAFTIL